MDEWVCNKLKAWGLEKWQSSFEEEEVNSTAFHCLTPDSIKVLIPKIGPQVLFEKYWNQEFGHLPSESIATNNIQNIETSSLSSDSFEQVDCKSVTLQTLSDSPATEVIREIKYCPSPPPLSPEVPGCSSDGANLFALIDSSDISLRPSLPINNLIDTLRDSAEGVAILTYYRDNRDLTDAHRSFLIELILYAELRSSVNQAITPQRLEQLSLMIKCTFPTEDIHTYYVPYRMDPVTRKKISAKGKLYDRHSFHRSFLLQSKSVKNLRGVKRKIVDRSTPVGLGNRVCASRQNPRSPKRLQWHQIQK